MKYGLLAAALVAAGVLLVTVGCETTPVQQGALLGGALGAGTGAIIGNNTHGHHGGTGALIGGAAGALGGALIGDQVEQQRKRQAYQGYAPTPPPPPPAPAPAPVYAPPPPPPPAPVPGPTVVERGHYEVRLVRTPHGETYEERVWVPDRY